MGPWDVTFKVQKSAGSPATDYINVKINGRQLGNTDQARGFHLETRSGHVAFEFEWETNDGSQFGKHMRLLDGTPTCAGCSHVRCRRVEASSNQFGTWEHGESKYRLVTYHHGHELEGGKHKCAWNAAHQTCLCQCGTNKTLQTGAWGASPSINGTQQQDG